MYKAYNEIVKQLEPYMDKVFFNPLKPRELKLLESKIGQQFPDYYRNFLLLFGMKQDFIQELIKQEEELITSYSYLPEQYKHCFLPIADNGGEEIWLLNTSDKKGQQLYEWQNWSGGEIVPLGFTFYDLIEKNIEDLRMNHESKHLNSIKKWCVQFVVPTMDEGLLLSAISAKRTKEWTETSNCLSNVRCDHSEIELGHSPIKLCRQHHPSWPCPVYYFDFGEPSHEIKKQSTIKKMDAQLKKRFSNYKLIDYGILPITDMPMVSGT